MTERYKVVDGSQTAHCCFVCTVVDTQQPMMIGDVHFEGEFWGVCECLDEESAKLICGALNRAAE